MYFWFLSSVAGTVLDDISKNRTCVHLEQCPCTLNGETYAPGDTMKAACRTWWVATGSLEDGEHLYQVTWRFSLTFLRAAKNVSCRLWGHTLWVLKNNTFLTKLTCARLISWFISCRNTNVLLDHAKQ